LFRHVDDGGYGSSRGFPRIVLPAIQPAIGDRLAATRHCDHGRKSAVSITFGA
jgi:hypothetical protein